MICFSKGVRPHARLGILPILFALIHVGACAHAPHTLEVSDARSSVEPLTVMPPYRIGAGDVIEVWYSESYSPSQDDYLLDVGDRMYVLVEDHSELSSEVMVRPDGRISLAFLGDVRVEGRTPQEVSAVLEARYAERIPAPVVTVFVVESHAKLNGFFQNLMSGQAGTTRTLQVRSDGKISLPFVGEVAVADKTVSQLQGDLSRRYREIFRYIDVCVNVTKSSHQQVAVLGEVKSPGVYDLRGTVGTIQAVALAGGFLPTAKQNSVIVIRRKPDKSVYGIRVRLKDVINNGNSDFTLRAQDIVYVPMTAIASIDKFVEQYMRKMMPLDVGTGVFFDVR